MRPSIAAAAVVSAGRDAVASLCDGVARRRTDRPRADLPDLSVHPVRQQENHARLTTLTTALAARELLGAAA